MDSRQHAKVGRKRKQFIMVLAQNDTAANFALEGDFELILVPALTPCVSSKLIYYEYKWKL